jgi:hypothetical protein
MCKEVQSSRRRVALAAPAFTPGRILVPARSRRRRRRPHSPPGTRRSRWNRARAAAGAWSGSTRRMRSTASSGAATPPLPGRDQGFQKNFPRLARIPILIDAAVRRLTLFVARQRVATWTPTQYAYMFSTWKPMFYFPAGNLTRDRNSTMQVFRW